jgi:predicted ATP-binding protein involved in virulence
MSHQFNFVLKKLVLVDSAGFCYSEIELDKHTILLGEGNVGKSSLLNCIRLFLLPEVNFNKAKDKFNFRSSNGDEYDKDQSFGHYFPSKYSHLIIEVEKIIGGKKYTHCQILSRGNNLAFERIFTTLSYNDI